MRAIAFTSIGWFTAFKMQSNAKWVWGGGEFFNVSNKIFMCLCNIRSALPFKNIDKESESRNCYSSMILENLQPSPQPISLLQCSSPSETNRS